jgi:molybdopterin-biosynthesis enzyme MoeA-like protein
MDDDDLKNCFAMFILGGEVMRGEFIDPHAIWRLADEMVKEKKRF